MSGEYSRDAQRYCPVYESHVPGIVPLLNGKSIRIIQFKMNPYHLPLL